MNARAALGRACRSGLGLAMVVSCGSRTTFSIEEGPPPPPECIQDKDCDGYGDRCFPVGCVAGKCKDLTPMSCDDRDPCTTDTCDPDTGKCSWSTAVLDLDGDMHFAPLSGKKPGDPDACGDDCDDTNPAAHPGGVEVCDGVDNDCDGVIDNDASVGASAEAVRVSEGMYLGLAGSLAYGDRGSYMAAFSGQRVLNEGFSVYLSTISQAGVPKPPAKFTLIPADAFGGPFAFTGDRFGFAWSDRRHARGNDNNYEVYFNIVNPDGTKRNPDLRVTNASDFSLSPSLAWTGNEFVLIWSDAGLSRLAENELFGQRIDVNGSLIGGNIKLAEEGRAGQTSPFVAAGQRTLGVVWLRGGPVQPQLMFAVFDHQLHLMGTPTVIYGGMSSGAYPVIVYNQSEYIIAWHDSESLPKTIYGAVRDELGKEVVAAKPIIKTTGQARYPAVLPYGDRALLVWSDNRDKNSGYELYAKMLNRRLDGTNTETRLTNAIGDSLDPVLSFGPNGEVGVLFNDARMGPKQVYFTHLECVTSRQPP